MRTRVLLLLASASLLLGCGGVTLKPVDFSWSFESVLTADEQGFVRGEPRTIAFSAEGLFAEELDEKGAAAGKTVRIIRDVEGYYFVTAAGFRNVYIFKGGDAELTLEESVEIDEAGMEKPFFNRRDQGIELNANGKAYLLNRKGIIRGGKK